VDGKEDVGGGCGRRMGGYCMTLTPAGPSSTSFKHGRTMSCCVPTLKQVSA
jgi:hypothetical protein